MLIGYARVSTQDQNLDLQIEALTKTGCKKAFDDECESSQLLTIQTHFTHYLAPNTGAVHSAVSIGCTYVRSHSRGGPNDSSRGPSHTTFRYADGLAIDDGVRGYGSESQAKG